ncbi:alpha-keto acid decarboxylase family protein [Acetobacter sacchari]|uniref:pyruvate decarboxylase n=1 Tax=Acetobacter sacchari TaxID=2661687 RepID=A0ABS3M180_9PROT|nr:thiamine pyrophosphate-dependent enzyme [Acetobacter sacchari]MBO1361965.1 alpha-keto acid decarboxylase family protein [Acetobacter sacchari]
MTTEKFTVGHYLSARLGQIGLKDHLAVAGDFNLVLLDQLLEEGSTRQIYSCNELNCGYTAEGYARANGAAAMIVTFNVGALSAVNAIGSAYAESLPVIFISGGPNTNDQGSGHILHHTIGTTNYGYQMEMVSHVTCAAEVIHSAENAPAQIDHAIRTALRLRKPAYIEIPCNLAGAPCVRPGPVSSLLAEATPDRVSLDAAVKAAGEFLSAREKVVILVGSRVRTLGSLEPIVALAERVGCAVTVMGAAKSFFPEDHPLFRGVYWGEISTMGAQELVESADGVVCLAPIFNDYATVGWQSRPKPEDTLLADLNEVTVDGRSYAGFHLGAFVSALAESAPRRPATGQTAKPAPDVIPASKPDAALTNDEMARQINALVDGNTTLTAETGDSWFNAVRMNLPGGAKVESEMQWGSIGWSVPAALGGAYAAPDRRHVLMVGDGSFQLTAQEVAQMVRYEVPVIIFLVNNRGYVIEIKIHDGPYNYIKNWDYAGLIDAFNAGEGHGLGLHAHNGAELAEAIEKAKANTRGPTLIECHIGQTDCTDMLVRWGKKVAAANSRPPAKA